jgi:single-stranded-DNA-specific exonuclease
MEPESTRRGGQGWDVPDIPEEEIYALSKIWSLDPVWVRVLFRRGIDPESFVKDIQDPVPPGDHCLGPMDFPRRWFHDLLSSAEPILIYADLDVDGISSAAILARFLAHRHHPFSVLLTNREDGRGLRIPRIRPYQEQGFRRIIVADMGASSSSALTVLQSEGIPCLVVDHHLIPEGWPREIVPLVHPSGKSALTSAGSAYALIRPYLTPDEEPQMAFLAGLSVLGDRAPLLRENRYFIQSLVSEEGLSAFPGIRLLLKRKVRRTPIVSDFSFGVIPLLNAPGRIGDPRPAFDLLMTTEVTVSEKIVNILWEQNRKRQEMEWLLYEEIRRKGPDGWFLFDKDWFPGVLGRVAHRISEEWNRTVFVGTLTETLTVRGSIRCRNDDRFPEIMKALMDLPIHGGGHPMAGGLEFPLELLSEVSDRLNQVLNAGPFHDDQTGGPISANKAPLKIDAFLPAYFRNPVFWDGYFKLFPFGEGFSSPQFGVRRARIERIEEGGSRMQVCSYRWRHGSGRAFLRDPSDTPVLGQESDLVVTPEIRGKGDYLERIFVVSQHRPAGLNS